MAITEAFKNAVSSSDVQGVRIMMKDSLLVDPTFTEFKEMAGLAARLHNLYDEHDGREFVEDSAAWDDTYMNMLMVQLIGNFSHERLFHLKKVVRKLRPVSVNAQQASPSMKSEKYYGDSWAEKVPPSGEKHNLSRNEKVVVYAVAGAAVGAAATIVAGATTIAVAAGTVVGAGLGAVAATVLTAGE